MKRRRLAFAALAAVVYLVALIALFPATLALRWFMPPVPGLVVGPVEGTIWNGRSSGVEYAGWNAGAMEWDVQPLALLGLALAADVRIAREGAPPLTAKVRTTMSGRTEISALQGTLALADLERMRLMPRNIARGDVIVNLQQLVLVDGRPMAAAGRVGLVGLQSTLLPDVALGSYEGEIETADDVVTVAFRDVEAPLRVSGEARLQPDGRYTVSGQVTPSGETPDSLRRGLVLLGQPDASGRYSFRFSGTLP